jgi:HTH-type transcriptional regulator, cell division transcriptional repressor
LVAFWESMGQKLVNIVGKRVKEARLRHKPPLTQDELSGQLAKLAVAIDRAGISKIEIGVRSVLDFEVKGLSKALGVTSEWLLGGKG